MFLEKNFWIYSYKISASAHLFSKAECFRLLLSFCSDSDGIELAARACVCKCICLCKCIRVCKCICLCLCKCICTWMHLCMRVGKKLELENRYYAQKVKLELTLSGVVHHYSNKLICKIKHETSRKKIGVRLFPRLSAKSTTSSLTATFSDQNWQRCERSHII